MHTWSCTLEVTTPMALAGVDQQRAELRPNTFKNRLRWWWRAGRGRRDREREARLFGDLGREAQLSGDLGRGQVGDDACPFRPRLYRLNALARSSVSYRRFKKINGFIDDDDNDRLQGLAYLGFSLDPFGDDNDPRGVIKPGARFKVKFIFQKWFGKDRKRELWASLWLLVWFGGLGARTRRGFGGMRVVDADDTSDLDLVSDAESTPDLRDFLENNLRIARDWLNAPDASEEVPLPEYTAIAPWWTEIFVHKTPERRWSAALEESGKHLMDFRNRFNINNRESDYYQVKNFLEFGLEPQTVDRSSFGLPLIFRYNSVKDENNTATVTGEDHHRRASPLFIQTCSFGDGWFARVYVVMKARLLKENEQLKVKSNREEKRVEAPDFDVLDRFLDHLVYHEEPLEVSL